MLVLAYYWIGAFGATFVVDSTDDLVDANPGVDPWLPGVGTRVLLPTQYVLPPVREGLVLNIAAKRLFYFPPVDDDAPPPGNVADDVVAGHRRAGIRGDWPARPRRAANRNRALRGHRVFRRQRGRLGERRGRALLLRVVVGGLAKDLQVRPVAVDDAG